MPCSYLKVTLGPMKAGKTDDILRQYNKYTSISKNVCIINHVYDEIRTNKKNSIRTHNGVFFNAISTNSLLKITEEPDYQNAEIVIIDESQFFTDLYIFIDDQLNFTTKKFYIYGLSGDVNQKKIGQILDIIPLADEIEHYRAYCSVCKDGTPAAFTTTNIDIPNQIFVEDSIYFPVCRKHKRNLKK